jgi:RNA recognition motif-containing protein
LFEKLNPPSSQVLYQQLLCRRLRLWNSAALSPLVIKSSMTIFVGGLSFDATQEDLTEVFAEYGTVRSVKIPTDRETGKPRGFGFVELSSEAEEAAAIEALDGAEWMGRDLRVNKAQPREGGRPPGGGNRDRGPSRRY